MSLDTEDITFLQEADSKLQSGCSIEQTAEEMDIALSTFYNRVNRLGYDIEGFRRLVPKRSPRIDELAVTIPKLSVG